MVADNADAAGRAAGAATADAGMRHAVAQARLQHGETLRHAHRLAVAVGQRDHAATPLAPAAHAAHEQHQPEQADVTDGEAAGDTVEGVGLRDRTDLALREIMRAPLAVVAVTGDTAAALVDAE